MALRDAFVRHYMAAEFVGRDDDLGRLDMWLKATAAGGPRLCMLTAPAGRGKSALVTRWTVRLRGELPFPVLFVPVSNRFHTNRPDIVLPLLAAELSSVLGVTPELPAIGAVEVYRDIIAELLGSFSGSEHRCLLVIDGLDETLLAGWDLGKTLLPASPPQTLCILVTARPLAGDAGATAWRNRLGWEPPAAAVAELDLGRLARGAVQTLLARIAMEAEQGFADTDLVPLADQVFRLSDEGDPLLVELIAADLREALKRGGSEGLASQLSRRNAGLQGYFEDWMREREQSFAASGRTGLVSPQVAEATLVVLASALGPLRHDELLALLERVMPAHAVPARSDLLRPLARFVLGDGETIGYTLGHPRFIAFLAEEQYAYTSLLASATAAFLQWGREVIDELDAGRRTQAPDYLLAWYPWHLLRHPLTQPADLSGVLSRAWVDASRAGAGDAAFALAAQAVLDRLLEMLNEVPAAAPGGEGMATVDGRVVGAALRASLFLASLREAAHFSSPYLLGLAIETGVLDFTAIDARLSLFRPLSQVSLLLQLARSTLPEIDALALWRRARDLAFVERSADCMDMLDEVLLASPLFALTPSSDDQPAWEEAIEVLRQRLAIQAVENPAVLRRLPLPWYGKGLCDPQLRSFPAARLDELARLLLEVEIEPGPLAAMLRAVAEANLRAVAVAAGDEVLPRVRRLQALRALVARLKTGNDRCGRIAESLMHRLDSLETSATNLSPQWELPKLRNERTAEAAAALALLTALGAPDEAIAALLESAGQGLWPGELAQLVAASPPLNSMRSDLREAIAARGWEAAREALGPAIRTSLRLVLAAHDTWTPLGLSDAVREEISGRGTDLLIAVGHRLTAGVLWELIGELSQFLDPERLSSVVRSIIRNAPTESRRLSLEKDLAQYLREDSEESWRFTPDGTLAREISSFASRPPFDRSEAILDILVQRAGQVVSRPVRARLLTQLADAAPARRKSSLVKEALTAEGVIDDRDVGIQAMTELACELLADAAEPVLSTLLAALSKLEPQAVVMTAANCAWRLPAGTRRDWAAAAAAATRSLPADSLAAARAAARVIYAFGDLAPRGLVAASLRTLGKIRTAGVGDCYFWLIEAKHWATSWRAIVQSLRRVNRMRPDEKATVLCSSLRRHPRLLFWVRSAAIDAVSRQVEGARQLERWLSLARSSKGRRRTLLIERAYRKFVTLLDSADTFMIWISEYNPVRSLFELVDPATREGIRQEIEACSHSEHVGLYKTCLFPALPPAERSQLGPQLLLAAPTPPPSTLDSSTRFNQIRVLFLFWEGKARRKPFTALLRVGAGVPRRTWLYGMPGVVRSLPPSIRAAVAASLREAIADAAAIWP